MNERALPPRSRQCDGLRPRIVPPKPREGERRPRPYSKADLDALRATVQSLGPIAMVTLKVPPEKAIIEWSTLLGGLTKMKAFLTNQKRRSQFPECIAVTEFDPTSVTGDVRAAGFHIGFKSALSARQCEMFKHWWLNLWDLHENQGRYFQYDSRGGGQSLCDYIAKDVSFRGGTRSAVKCAPSWVPARVEMRLWFCVGVRRSAAKDGRRMRASTGRILSRFDGEHGKPKIDGLKASTRTSESEHASPLITTDQSTSNGTQTKSVQAVSPVSVPTASSVSPLEIETPTGRFCLPCWNRGKALWPTCCRCTGHVV